MAWKANGAQYRRSDAYAQAQADLVDHLRGLIHGKVVSTAQEVVAAVKERHMEQWMHTVRLALEDEAAVRRQMLDEQFLLRPSTLDVTSYTKVRKRLAPERIQPRTGDLSRVALRRLEQTAERLIEHRGAVPTEELASASQEKVAAPGAGQISRTSRQTRHDLHELLDGLSVKIANASTHGHFVELSRDAHALATSLSQRIHADGLSDRQATGWARGIAAVRRSLGHLMDHYRRMRDSPDEAGLAVDASVDAIRLRWRRRLYDEKVLAPLGAADRSLHQAVLSLNEFILSNRG